MPCSNVVSTPTIFLVLAWQHMFGRKYVALKMPVNLSFWYKGKDDGQLLVAYFLFNCLNALNVIILKCVRALLSLLVRSIYLKSAAKPRQDELFTVKL